jgi:hypothetical protein
VYFDSFDFLTGTAFAPLDLNQRDEHVAPCKNSRPISTLFFQLFRFRTKEKKSGIYPRGRIDISGKIPDF